MQGYLWWTALAITFVLAMTSRQVVLAVTALSLALASGISRLWERFGLSGVSYERSLEVHHLFPGEETLFTLTVTNVKPLPLPWIQIRDRFPAGLELDTGTLSNDPAMHRSWLVTSLTLGWYQRFSRTHRLRAIRRGRYHIGPAELVTGGVFGFNLARRRDSGIDTLIVFPQIFEPEQFGLAADSPLLETLGHRPIVPDPLQYMAVRDYVPGDSPRFIHWKASARTHSFKTKRFDPGAITSLLIAVDVQTSERAYEQQPEHLEYIVSLAASLAVRALREHHMVGLCANTFTPEGENRIHVGPGRNPQQATQLLAALAGLDSFRSMPFELLLHRLLFESRPLDTIVAITARPSEAICEALLALKEMGRGVYLLVIGEHADLALPDGLQGHYLGGADAWRQLVAQRT